jgi:hypothetical protein
MYYVHGRVVNAPNRVCSVVEVGVNMLLCLSAELSVKNITTVTYACDFVEESSKSIFACPKPCYYGNFLFSFSFNLFLPAISFIIRTVVNFVTGLSLEEGQQPPAFESGISEISDNLRHVCVVVTQHRFSDTCRWDILTRYQGREVKSISTPDNLKCFGRSVDAPRCHIRNDLLYKHHL